MKGIAKAMLSRMTNMKAGRYKGAAFTPLINGALRTRRKVQKLDGRRSLLSYHCRQETRQDDDGHSHIFPHVPAGPGVGRRRGIDWLAALRRAWISIVGSDASCCRRWHRGTARRRRLSARPIKQRLEAHREGDNGNQQQGERREHVRQLAPARLRSRVRCVAAIGARLARVVMIFDTRSIFRSP